MPKIPPVIALKREKNEEIKNIQNSQHPRGLKILTSPFKESYLQWQNLCLKVPGDFDYPFAQKELLTISAVLKAQYGDKYESSKTGKFKLSLFKLLNIPKHLSTFISLVRIYSMKGIDNIPVNFLRKSLKTLVHVALVVPEVVLNILSKSIDYFPNSAAENKLIEEIEESYDKKIRAAQQGSQENKASHSVKNTNSVLKSIEKKTNHKVLITPSVPVSDNKSEVDASQTMLELDEKNKEDVAILTSSPELDEDCEDANSPSSMRPGN